ncbi:alkaline phosphatase family protein [Sediminibacterium sp.]|uniref:alkaline phosphatase family protein n=1 Tax=Sediminibacterium sp. TaxID=1917865 RepID=UPI0025F4F3AE|nr:alkaline phosphatase family protein [Sediminibacterium sp.]MBW0177773.1 alkaline phosphatase family protein [Sediminibacterium sp.]
MKKNSLFIMVLLTCLQVTAQVDTSIKTLIVFFDGLRPDYITPELMPNVYAFSKRGSYGKQHHSVFPTVTRVNSSSYSTGSYPGTNGIMGNTVYFPQVNPVKGLNTGDAAELNKIAAATNDRLLTAVSLGEALESVGQRMMVFSSGSTGQALLQNHKVGNGAIVNTSMILPASFKDELVNVLGPIPAHGKPNSAQHKWITDALLQYGFVKNGPLVNAIWYSDPDGAAHSDGIGSVAANASIKSVDEQFGRIITALDEKGMRNKVNIIISTDHGFVTKAGKLGVADFLIQKGIKKDRESDDIVAAEGALYVKNHDPELIRKVVTALQQEEWVGAIFTKADKTGSMKGWIPGTLSFDAIHWNHPERTADILVDENWNDAKNSTGYAGTSYARGVAGHGGFSPYEVHIALLADGPSFKKAFEGNLPTSNVDIAPTVLSIHHIPAPSTMKGRAFSELLIGSKAPPATVKKGRVETSTVVGGITYKLLLDISTIGKYRYINYAKTERTTDLSMGK